MRISVSWTMRHRRHARTILWVVSIWIYLQNHDYHHDDYHHYDGFDNTSNNGVEHGTKQLSANTVRLTTRSTLKSK